MMTKYGELKGMEDISLYPNGYINSCRVTEFNELKTSIGILIPQYETKDERRKLTGTLEFYENGDLMYICLDEQVNIKTNIGIIPAEKILFYENEKIKRIFPLNGKLSGYWTEENEYNLAKIIHIKNNKYSFSAKFISIAFYKSGNLKSLTLWPMETLTINNILIRKGISFYEDGEIKSLEPAKEVNVATPIGNIKVFNNEINGLHGDINSLEYYDNGDIKSLYTCSSLIKIINEKKENFTIKPILKAGWCNETIKYPVPIKVDFFESFIRFNENIEFQITNSSFKIESFSKNSILEELICS